MQTLWRHVDCMKWTRTLTSPLQQDAYTDTKKVPPIIPRHREYPRGHTSISVTPCVLQEYLRVVAEPYTIVLDA